MRFSRVDFCACATLALWVSLVAGCDSRSSSLGEAAPSAAGSARIAAPGSAELHALRSAEQRRDSAAVRDADRSSRDTEVRRAAARSLARIADSRAVDGLLGLLRDNDPEVLRWAAYGLGYACQGREQKLVRRLSLRAASWVARAEAEADGAPLAAIAQALARCGTEEAERTLRGWLVQTELKDQAALALGNLAALHKRLDDASMVALLEAASKPKDAPEHALYAFSQLSTLNPTVQARLLEVARAALSGQGATRTFAIRALGSAGAAAAEPLSQVLASADYSASERCAAGRALRQLGAAGQQGLARALSQLLATAQDDEKLLSASYGPVLVTLEGLGAPPAGAQSELATLAGLELADEKQPAQRRRQVRLRCTAAALLAGRASASKRLVHCDPDPKGSAGQLAKLSVLDRGSLSGARLKAWRRLVDSGQPVVQQAALRLLGAHAEVPSAHSLLAEALASDQPGTVATAAQILAAYPERAGAGSSDSGKSGGQAPVPTIMNAFQKSLERWGSKHSVEVVSALMDAAGALQLLSAKTPLERFCTSDQPTLREHAERALRLLGEKKRRCDSFTPPSDPPDELAKAERLEGPVKLRLKTDIGELSLTLDPTWAPVAVERILELAKAGYYDQMPVHRVVPGFVAQFGDRVGDGFGQAGRPPLRCETAPIDFGAFEVGMALAGRDTGASQIFVTLDRYPRLDGNYAWLGRAEPGWARLAEGDRILEVSVVE